MKKNMRRAWAWVMILCMVLSLVPAAVIPVRAEENAPTVNGGYVNGEWTQGGNGTVSYDVDGTEVTLSKTAQAVEGMENTYDITLSVRTSTSTSLKTNAGAVVLVIDRSNSMKYCADCGGNGRHDSDCEHYSRNNNEVTTAQNRMTAAKGAAAEFLASYAGTNPAADRQLCIVTFGTDADVEMSWHNVAGGSGSNDYDTAAAEISGINIRSNAQLGGTNLELGLYTALNQLSEVSDYGTRSVITLTDGIPTYRMGRNGGTAGDGSNGSSENNTGAKNRADAIKNTGAELYTVCFGVADDVTYSGGPTVGNFLRDSIASSGCAYNANNSDQLYAAFRAITESITSGLSGKGWTATDPMTPYIDVTGGTGDSFYKAGAHYTWELSNVSTETEGNTTYYIYTYTYRVTFDPQFEGFVEGQYYPTNEETYLNIDGEQYAFPVPGVQGTLPRRDVTVTKVWNDEGNQDGIRPTSVTVQLMEGEHTIGEPVVLNADNGWSYTWDGDTYDLIYKSEGKVHVYTVVELDTHKEYTASATFENSQITLTNTHEVYRKDITVTKMWDD